MSHTQAEMTAYKKTLVGTTGEAADGTILPVDRFGTVEVGLDKPGTNTKPVKMVSVAYMPGRSQNLLSTRKAVKQCGKPLVYYKTKATLGFPGGESLFFYILLSRGIAFPNRCETDPESRGSARVGSMNG